MSIFPAMPNHIRSVLFDLDGTLIDSIELILSSYRHTLEIHRGTVPPNEVWLEGLGTPLWEQFRKFTQDQAEIDAMVATYREHNIANHDAMIREYPGVRAAVERLHAAGKKLGIVTSKLHSSAERGLRLCGYGGLFDVLVGADDVERPKPHPEPVHRALEALGASADEAVFVGDSPHDLASGRAAGVRIGAVSWGPFSREALEAHEPDYWFETAEELVALV